MNRQHQQAPGRQQVPPGYYYTPPHNAPEAVFVNAPRGGDTPVTKLTVPLLLVGTMAIFLVSVTYSATSNFGDIKHAIDKLSDKVQSLTGELSQRISRVESGQSELKRQQWSKDDHDLFCAKAEKANIGWTCGDDANNVSRFSPKVGGWTARAKP